MRTLTAIGLALATTALLAGPVRAADEALPKPDAPFAGKIDADRDKAVPAWPQPVKAKEGAPNILLVLLDDVGFGSGSVSGGPIQTPELDKLAGGGLRYNNFHVNSLCSPTRASLLSGRNNHQIGFAHVAEGANAYPGHNSTWPKNAASVARVLKDNGYSTAAFGKWHNTPTWEVTPVGPFERWPTGLGFEYFYGFLSAQDNQYEPRLYRGTSPVEPPATKDQGYHLTNDLANDAIHWLHQHDAVAPQKPFFLYFATGAVHTPHHVTAEWTDKYKGKFDQGWDKLREETFARQKAQGIIPANAELTPRPAELPAWDSLSPEQKKLLSREAEVLAGFLEQTDHEVGRVIQAIKDEGKFDNTLVLYIVGDNGASAEGGPEGLDKRTVEGKLESIENRTKEIDKLGSELYLNHYASAWAWGLDAPFQWTKQVASHLGGTTDPLVVSWPAKIKDNGAVRGQFQHVTDIAPTLYEIAGITPPKEVDGIKQVPLEGHSLSASFIDGQAPSTHPVQYFELLGNVGIYKDGWWAGRRHLLPWQSLLGDIYEKTPLGQHPWELYNLKEDYSQAHDLAAKYPEKLKELQALFDKEAKRNNVYPLIPHAAVPPQLTDGRSHFVYFGDVDRLPPKAVPILRGKSHSITAEVEIPANGANGVVIAQGGRFGGFTLYVKDGKPVYEVNANSNVAGKLVGAEPLPAGKVVLGVEFVADPLAGHPLDRTPGKVVASGKAVLTVNGKVVAEGKIANSIVPYNETLDISKDLGSPVSPDYQTPNAFTGKVEKVTLDLK